MEVTTAYFIAGAIIFIGFFADIFFSKTGIPDVLLLLLLGIFLGPVLNLVSSATLMQIAPYFSALALILLLLEGGMHLNFRKVIHEFSSASFFTIVVFLISIISVSFVSMIFGWPLINGVLLGAVVGGTSSAIVIPLLLHINVKDEIRTLLSLESAFTDALCITISLAIVSIIVSGSFNFHDTVQTISSAFSVAIVVGFAVGMFWLKILRNFKGKPLAYLLTIGICFIMYAIVESLKGNGTIASLIFGIVLGNSKEIEKVLGIGNGENDVKTEYMIEKFNAEFSFFIKTFFFVYLGMLFHFSAFQFNVLLFSLFVGVALIGSRYFSTQKILKKENALNKELVGLTMPRGLAAAVLSSLPVTYNLDIPFFTEIVISVIFITNIVTVFEVYQFSRKSPREKIVESGVASLCKIEQEANVL